MFSKPDGYTYREDRCQVLEEYRHKIVVSQGEEPMQLNWSYLTSTIHSVLIHTYMVKI